MPRSGERDPQANGPSPSRVAAAFIDSCRLAAAGTTGAFGAVAAGAADANTSANVSR